MIGFEEVGATGKLAANKFRVNDKSADFSGVSSGRDLKRRA
jgi:hypothetical protein